MTIAVVVAVIVVVTVVVPTMMDNRTNSNMNGNRNCASRHVANDDGRSPPYLLHNTSNSYSDNYELTTSSSSNNSCSNNTNATRIHKHSYGPNGDGQ